MESMYFLSNNGDFSASYVIVKPRGYQAESSSVENPGWLGYIGDYTTQLYGDYNKPI